MRSMPENTKCIGVDPYKFSQSTACSEPWWRNTGYNSIPPAVIAGNASNSYALEQPRDGQSQSDGRLNEEDDAIEESRVIASTSSDGTYGQEHQKFQHVTSTIPPRNDESLTHPPQLELVGHSIACASNPYSDPYYGGTMAVYGPQPLVHPHLFDMHQARMPLPFEMAQEPVYVNAKQYNGIMRRRKIRAKAELEKKLIKNRKPYLHESRHQHAMRRARSSGGRFAKKSATDESKCTEAEKGKSSVSAMSSQSPSSSGSEPLHSESSETRSGHQEASGPKAHGNCKAQGYLDGNNNGQYQNHGNSQTSAYIPHSAEGEGEGDSSGEQWRTIPSKETSQEPPVHAMSSNTASWGASVEDYVSLKHRR